MQRLYESILKSQFQIQSTPAFLVGPRQVGKTTIATSLKDALPLSTYLKGDNLKSLTPREDSKLPSFQSMSDLKQSKVIEYTPPSLLIIDEIQKHKNWQTLVGELLIKPSYSLLITGKIYFKSTINQNPNKGSKSLLYRVHPLSVSELIDPSMRDAEILLPAPIENELYQNLLKFGGFPKPLLAGNQKTYTRWKNHRIDQLFEEDIQKDSRINEDKKMRLLADTLQTLAGKEVNYSTLSKTIQVSDQTIRAWIASLESFYYCYMVRPWSLNVERSLTKEPKAYLYDWSSIKDKRQRYKNFIASHLLKAVQFWTDDGLAHFELHYLRDKDQHAVDFLITRNQIPWILVETSATFAEPVSKNLQYFQKKLSVPYAFQVAVEEDYSEINCFEMPRSPFAVSAKTFLSQLV